MKASHSVALYSLVCIWWLVVISFVVDPYLVYLEVANPDGSSQIPFAWKAIGTWSSLSRGALYLPFLISYPHSHSSSTQKNWLLHSIGVVALTLSLFPLVLPSRSRAISLALLDFVGIISGRAAAVYLGMLLLTASRRSTILNFHGFGYLDLIVFHKAAGWWCVVMSFIHSLAYLLYYVVQGGVRRVWSACLPTTQCFRKGHWEPCLNTLGLVNFFGVVGTIVIIVLAVYSREQVRRRTFENFYVVHILTGFFFVFFVALHDFPTMILAFAGLAFYSRDRWVARRSRACCSEVTSKVICENLDSRIVILTWKASAPRDLMPGSRWIYLRVENIATLQWHPLSIIQIHDCMHVFVKGLGDWSSSLCELVASGASLQITTEGPYGKPACKPVASRALVLVAGGIGISPFVDLLCSITPDSIWWRSITLIWAVRRHEFDGLSSILDLESLSRIAGFSVFITSEDREMSWERVASIDPVISSSLGSVRLPTPAKIHVYGSLFFTCVLLATFGWITSWLHDRLLSVSVSTLVGYTFARRVAPVVIGVVLAVLSSVVLLNSICYPNRREQKCDTVVDERLEVLVGEGEHVEQRRPQIHVAKPDLHQEIEQEAIRGPLDVQVCGPERMTLCVVQAVKVLCVRGHIIKLNIHNSAL